MRSGGNGSNVRSVSSVAGFTVAIGNELSRVVKISFRGSKPGTLGVTQIHVLPGNLVRRINTAGLESALDWPRQGPSREAAHYRRRADEVRLYRQGIVSALDANLFDS